MEILPDVLIKIFRYISTKDIISGEVQFDNLTLQLLGKISYAYDEKVDELELYKKLQYLKDRMEFGIHEEGNSLLSASWNNSLGQKNEKEGLNVFDLVNSFAKENLIKDHEEVVCQIDQLQAWRQVSCKIGEDLFVAALYAYIDYQYGKIRTTFFWRNMIGHNDCRLNIILSQGVSENHFHLHGSTPYFDLSWLDLMNCVNNPRFPIILDQIDRERRNPRMVYKSTYEEPKYKILHMQAALIRVFLYSQLTDKRIELGHYTAPWSWLLEFVFQEENVIALILQYEELWNSKNPDGDKFDLSNVVQDELFQKKCPAFCWIIGEILPHFLNEDDSLIILDKTQYQNLPVILRKVTSCCPEIPLNDCRWIFALYEMDGFNKEWDRQTYVVLMYYLRSPMLLLGMRNQLQRIIDGFQDHYHQNKKDYAINATSSWYSKDSSYAVLSGERWLLYSMMRRRYERFKKPSKECYNLFFAYLTVKESFRMELLQSNDRIGFTNFQKYQNRKYWFTVKYSAGELARMAVDTVFKNHVINNFEIRIHPGNSCRENVEIIRGYDKAIDPYEKYRKYFYYVFHFSRRPDEKVENQSPLKQIYYRHYELRKKVQKQVESIIQFRRKNPEIAQRLRGIDTCSLEDGCRPEVFATAYRILKQHSCYQGLSVKPEVPQLRATYHVGEVFQDILDGLRAVDEAIRFLSLNCGDRLGHAIVLGLDTETWYREREYTITIRKQDYLDNLVWLYHRLIRYQIPDSEVLQEYLKKKFQFMFSMIYEKAIDTNYIESILMEACKYDSNYGEENRNGINPYDFNIYTYYYSWMLRGDHPELYEDGYYKQIRDSARIWDYYSVNSRFPKDHKIRYIPAAVTLNHYYQYNPLVKKEGNKSIVVQIPANMVMAISAVQKKMQREIVSRGIAIETNPSSNVMVSTFKSYDRHPIVQFYNKGLTYNSEKLMECAQLNVSINTDDQGVFATSLSNEYALMVSALAQMKDENGNHVYQKDMIYDWIDNIRKMGNEQSFQQDVNNSTEKILNQS